MILGRLVPSYRRLDGIRKRTDVMPAVSRERLLLREGDLLGLLHRADAGERDGARRRQESLVADAAAGLSRHLPGVADVAEARGRDVDLAGRNGVRDVANVRGAALHFARYPAIREDASVERLFENERKVLLLQDKVPSKPVLAYPLNILF